MLTELLGKERYLWSLRVQVLSVGPPLYQAAPICEVKVLEGHDEGTTISASSDTLFEECVEDLSGRRMYHGSSPVLIDSLSRYVTVKRQWKVKYLDGDLIGTTATLPEDELSHKPDDEDRNDDSDGNIQPPPPPPHNFIVSDPPAISLSSLREERVTRFFSE